MNAILKSPYRLAFTLAMVAVAIALFSFGMHAEAAGVLMANGPVGAGIEELAREFSAKNAEFKSVVDALKASNEEMKTRLKAGETLSESFKASLDDFLTKFNGLREEIGGIEQKMAAIVDEEQKTAKTWGEQLIATESYKSHDGRLGQKRNATAAVEVKQVTSAAAGGLIRQPRVDSLVSLTRERFVMRDLLPTIPVQESAITYAKQTTRTNNAAPVAEGTAKPYSDYVWSSATVVVKTLAHLGKLTRQAMDDAPRLVAEVDSEMRYGLGYVEERQFLYGSNVGENLNGIMPQATAFARPAGVGQLSGVTRLDSLRIAILQAALANMPADGIVMNELDWALIEILKDTTGRYLIGDPNGNQAAKRLWGLPVVNTPAMAAGDFLVGNFRMGAVVYDRMAVEVLLSTENADDFEKNLATMRAEERVALAVKRTFAFVKGTFATAKTLLEAP